MGERVNAFFSEVKFVVRSTIHCAIAEFLGTFVLIVIGIGSIAQSELTGKGGYTTVTWGWALGCTLGILIAANVSGGHINPAVTLAFAVNRTFSWKKVPIYWLAQYIGALIATATVFGIYSSTIVPKLATTVNGQQYYRISQNESDPGYTAIFANFPSNHPKVGAAFAEEVMATAIFMTVILTVTDKTSNVPSYLQPVFIGSTLLAIGVSYGANNGFALNPARDFSPRLITCMITGSNVFRFNGYNWFWVFILGPHLGALFGVVIFYFFNKSNRWDPAEHAALNNAEQEAQSSIQLAEIKHS